MNKRLSLIALSLMCMSQVVSASSIYIDQPHFISNRFSIKPHFNTGEGKLVISNRFSIKPAFNSGLTKYFYSGVISILDMPDVEFLVDSVPLKDGVKVKDDSILKIKADYSTCSLKDKISKAEYYIEDVDNGDRVKTDNLKVIAFKIDQELDNNLESERVYRLGQVVSFTDGFKYEVKSSEFRVDERGLIEFIKPNGHMIFEKYIIAEYDISNTLAVNTYNLYLEKEDNTRVQVGVNLKFVDTKKSDTNDGTLHEFRYKLPDGVKSFKHIVEIVD